MHYFINICSLQLVKAAVAKWQLHNNIQSLHAIRRVYAILLIGSGLHQSPNGAATIYAQTLNQNNSTLKPDA